MDPRSNGPDYSTLPAGDAIFLTVPVHPPKPRNSSASAVVLAAFLAVLLLVSFVALVPPSPTKEVLRSKETEREVPALVFAPRGLREGVSGKSSGMLRAGYTWTNEMLQWQRSTFHFQPQQNWMNDPNAPVFYNGYYHLFYQYNPDSAVWGNITWGHAVSRDLINWFHLPLAMVADKWYDSNGVWSGSATILPDGRLIVLYTGSTNASVQVQNLAVPADPADPLLLNWVKSPANPILTPPPGIGTKDFRDPTTAWYVESESNWRIAIGSKDDDHNGLVLVYATKDFVEYERLPGAMHVVPGIGMWECVDFFPVAVDGEEGLDTSANGPGVKHVLKASLDDDKHDYYAIGSYDVESNKWTPDNVEADVGLGWRLDYGKYYASKTFYDQVKKRRVLWGWTGETDSEEADILKGWASLQTIPRTVTYDAKTGSNLLQWPVEEVNSLRKSEVALHNITIPTGSVLPLEVREATQLDIEAEFELDKEALEQIIEADVGYNCSTSGGAAGRGALGPFGLLVLANEKLSEQTAVYFYVAKGTDGNLNTFICQDELRSSKANDLVKRVYGSIVPVLDGEKLSVRVMIDHSIVETFAQRGRTCITSRVYPTAAIYSAARLFLFNNATGAHVKVTSVKMWEMESASIKPYDFTKDANMHSIRAQ